MARRLLLLSALFLVVAAMSFAAGQQGTTTAGKWPKVLKIAHLGNGPATKPAVEDVVTPYFRQQTGMEVTCRPYLPDMDAVQNAQTLIASNDVPESIGRHGIPPNADAIALLEKNPGLWEFSKANIEKYMPRFAARIKKWGDLDIWLENEKRIGGKNYAMSSGIDPKAFPQLIKEQGMDSSFMIDYGLQIGSMHGIALRDDILKKIFPNAKSQKELMALYIQKNGNISSQEAFGDIPINSLADMKSYLQKAKAIIDAEGLKDATGNDKMIAGIPWCTTCEGAATLGWSWSSAYGYIWNEPPFSTLTKTDAYYIYSMPDFVKMTKWANELYNEGLIDPEIFAKKGDLLSADVTKGRYAVINNWQTGMAVQAAADNKYPFGYRVLMAWWPSYPLKMDYVDGTNRYVTYHTHSGLLLTKKLKEADLPQAFNWVDFMMSEENDILHAWGPPSFYTGTGKDRRFKAEYKDMENHKVYGILGGKDGYYYGAAYGRPDIDWAYVNEENAAVGFFASWSYPEAPMYVYPPEKVTEKTSYVMLVNRSWNKLLGEQAKRINFYPQIGWSENDLVGIPSFSKLRYLAFDQNQNRLAQVVVAKPENYQAALDHYMSFFPENGYPAAMAEVTAKWREIFDKYVKQYWK
jgi:hypothetical protein